MSIKTSKIANPIVNKALDLIHSDMQPTAKNFQQTIHTIRKTYSFGYDYFSLHNGDRTFTEIPKFIEELCQHCIESLDTDGSLGNYKEYTNIIVSIYEAGYCLQPHIDVDHREQISDGKMVDFYFGSQLFGVILEADQEGRLYFVKSDSDTDFSQSKKIVELDETAGMTFLISGDLRHKPYYHGVSKVIKSRVSVTFRTVKFTSD